MLRFSNEPVSLMQKEDLAICQRYFKTSHQANMVHTIVYKM